MKNVILYVRVSTDEQAGKGYSLRDQEQKLLNYCQNNNLNVLHIFREDFSAKTFKRPEFKRLLEYCKKNKQNTHELIFIKWDRFSRNTAESYQMIGVFNQLGIRVNAIEQPLDLTIPEQGLMLAVYLSMPEVENHRRSLNVIAGMRRAFKEGRYVGNTPKGYSNGVDASNKPLLVPSDDSKYVVEAFELMAGGIYNQMEILGILKRKGFKTSKTAIASMFRNHLYYGSVFIKAYKDEKECIVEGIHEPIITKKLYNKVQDVLNHRSDKYQISHKKLNENFPLKGFLLCPHCNKPLTASSSKGRNRYYTYYHCMSPCTLRYKLEDVDLWFNDFLKSLTLDKPIQKLFVEIVKDQLSNLGTKELGPKHYEKVKNIEDKLERLQDLYIDQEIDKKGYIAAKERYEAIREELKANEVELKEIKNVMEVYEKGIMKIAGLEKHYLLADLTQRRQIIGSMFPKKFQFENNKVRTADLNPILLKITSINKGLALKNKKDKSKKIDLSWMVGDEGFEPPTLWV